MAASGTCNYKPANLWVRSLRQPQISGRYGLQPSDRFVSNELPVWKQTKGPGWIYNSQEGLWFVTVHEACLGKTGGVIGGLQEEASLPTEITRWKRWDGPSRGWNESLEAGEILITDDSKKGDEWEAELDKLMNERWTQAPDQLEIVGPSDDTVAQDILGKYRKRVHGDESDTYHCAQPIYEKESDDDNNKTALFGDSFGFWRVSVKGLFDGVGLLQSNDIVAPPHMLPHEVQSWMTDGAGCGCGEEEANEEEKAAEWTLNPAVSIRVFN